MSKWFEVEVQRLVVYAVEVKDDENERDAIEIAGRDEGAIGRYSYSAQPLPSTHMGTFIKHAHTVRPLEPALSEDEDDE